MDSAAFGNCPVHLRSMEFAADSSKNQSACPWKWWWFLQLPTLLQCSPVSSVSPKKEKFPWNTPHEYRTCYKHYTWSCPNEEKVNSITLIVEVDYTPWVRKISFLNNEQIDVDINFNDITSSFLFGKCSRRSRSWAEWTIWRPSRGRDGLGKISVGGENLFLKHIRLPFVSFKRRRFWFSICTITKLGRQQMWFNNVS